MRYGVITVKEVSKKPEAKGTKKEEKKQEEKKPKK